MPTPQPEQNAKFVARPKAETKNNPYSRLKPTPPQSQNSRPTLIPILKPTPKTKTKSHSVAKTNAHPKAKTEIHPDAKREAHIKSFFHLFPPNHRNPSNSVAIAIAHAMHFVLLRRNAAAISWRKGSIEVRRLCHLMEPSVVSLPNPLISNQFFGPWNSSSDGAAWEYRCPRSENCRSFSRNRRINSGG